MDAPVLRKIILQGGGEHARVVLDCLLSEGFDVLGIYDPRQTGELFGIPFLGCYEPEAHSGALSIIAIGDNRVRKQVAETSRHGFTNVIHRSCVLSPFATVGTGNMILHQSVVQAQARVGNHVILNTACQVDHDCVIEDHVHIGPGSVLCGNVKVGEGAFIGAGSVVIPGRSIGKWSTVGAGSVVIRDVPDYAVVIGNPARVIRKNNA